MCGLVVVLDLENRLDISAIDNLRKVSAAMVRRGPDGEGEWISPCGRIAMAHRRLAIIDLSPGGHQPMSDENARYTVVFNGEIYNYSELRLELEKLGFRFTSRSDTEVLLHAYACWGDNCLPKLRGMFSFVIWDALRKCIFAARDVFGIKPLYYRREGSRIWFASQCKALIPVSNSLKKCIAGKVGFLLWGAIPEPWTPFVEIKVLPSGYCLEVECGEYKQPKLRSWLSLREVIVQALEQPNLVGDTSEYLSVALRDSVKAHLIADVPVGVFLSAGLDSCTLASLAAEMLPARQIKTVTLGFREYAGTFADEVPMAESVARLLGTDHQTVWVSRDDFVVEAERILASMDMPTQDGINSYFVSLAANRAGLKTALSGLGGDELFGSYPSFKQVPRWAALPKALQQPGRMIRRLASRHPSLNKWPKQISAFEFAGSLSHAYLLRRSLFLPWELERYIPPEQVEVALSELATLSNLEDSFAGINDSQIQVSALEASWYMRQQLLRDADWASMAHGLELRVPFVDINLWRAVFALHTAKTRVTKRDMALSPQALLPDAILRRPKSGFSVPVAEWFRSSLAQGDVSVKGRGLRPWALDVYEKWFDSL